jgi:hypothetical protein
MKKSCSEELPISPMLATAVVELTWLVKAVTENLQSPKPTVPPPLIGAP